MTLPITFCTKGHNFCNDCRTTLDNCEICHSPFSGVRNLNIENISLWSANPCPNTGCPVSRPAEFMEDHLFTCQYVNMMCPLNKIPIIVCPWEGLVKDLQKHFEESHKGSFTEGNTFKSSGVIDGLQVISYEEELFIYCKQLKEDKLHCAVQKVGCTGETFVAYFSLDLNNGFEKITVQQKVTKTDEDFETMFKNGKGMIINKKLYQKYIFGGNMSLNIAIKKLKTK